VGITPAGTPIHDGDTQTRTRLGDLPDREEGFPRDVATAILALAVMLIVFQYRTLAKLIVLPAGSTSWDLGSFVDAVRREVEFDFVDGMLCVLILGPILYILVAEFRNRRFTRFLTWIFDDERRTVAALALASLVSVRYYFAIGALSWAVDAPQHLSYLDITTEIFSNFELPIWTNYYGTGSPFLQFYGFLGQRSQRRTATCGRNDGCRVGIVRAGGG